MQCHDVQSRLSAYYDGELNASEIRTVELHLRDCKECQAELAAFKSISASMASTFGKAALDPSANPSWEQLSARLSDTAAATTSVWAPWATGLALAATLLVSVFLYKLSLPSGQGEPKQLSHHEDIDHSNNRSQSTGGALVDLSEAIDQFADRPARAYASLTKKYSSQPVDGQSASQALGYVPSVLTSLPGGARLVSTSVLRLPACKCENGKCRCGPGGCNCAAALCQRNDGTEFLVLEHCESKDVTYGQQPERMLTGQSGGSKVPIKLFGDQQHLTASWSHAQRRITAIGLKNEREARELVSRQID